MVNGVPQQGDIITIDLDPRMGHEQQGFRPVIVLSNNIISQIYQCRYCSTYISNTTQASSLP
ncbi:MAG: type II toxin-antitoxin system PemK/MazF family toxin [Treponema sp.]|jgi:mRNA-degrading endonuclease toxin of MazEF toxin-antitoxin module|nr:type II toxin-antitoxin system PemK/MazF family toxin [Treponema sp.]